MPRRCLIESLPDEPPKKRPHLAQQVNDHNSIKSKQYLKDLYGNEWTIGQTIGIGGFGVICLASPRKKVQNWNSSYVAKIEKHENGPLFVEINCYIRIAKPEMIEEWKAKNNLLSLGMPHYIASGSYKHKNQRYRFLILPKYEKDLEKILQDKIKLNLKTVLTISCQILDVLEYIHSKGFIHSDIKASNILLTNSSGRPLTNPIKNTVIRRNLRQSCRIKNRPTVKNLRPIRVVNYKIDEIEDEENEETIVKKTKDQNNTDQVYLLDYGLTSKYLSSNGEHKPFCVDERRAHAGTLLFCSRDAHKGCQSRRSDLESLGYNIIYWLTGNLPWLKESDPEIIEKMKLKALANPEEFLQVCFNQYPTFLLNYFSYLQKLQFEEKPDYNHLKTLFKDTLKQYGYKDDSCFDFDNLEGWGQKQKKTKRTAGNVQMKHISYKFLRPPLRSNIPQIRPLLRKKLNNEKLKKAMRWSQILMDPENILRQAKRVETNESTLETNLTKSDLRKLNPTQAMIEVFNKAKERGDSSPSNSSDCNLSNIDGYTPAMMSVWRSMQERQILELDLNEAAQKLKHPNRSRRRKDNTILKQKCAKSVSQLPELVRYVRNDFEQRRKKTNLRRMYSLRG